MTADHPAAEPAEADSPPSDAPRPPFALGRFTVHADELCLRDGDRVLRLQQKEMTLLLALVERAETGGPPLSSADLRRAVWGDQAITDGAAKNLVWQLRTSLGESADAPVLIHTVPGVGYRLGEVPRPLPEGRPADPDPSETSTEEPDSPTEHAPPPPRRARRLLALGLSALALAVAWGIFSIPTAFDSDSNDPEAPASSAYGAPRPVAGLAGRELDLDLDPSGRFLLFSGSETNGEPTDLYRLDLEEASSYPDRLTHTPGITEAGGSWSPDGRRIAFVRSAGDGEDWEIHVMAAAGGPSKHIASAPFAFGPNLAWRGDGEALFVARASGKKRVRLYLLELEGGSFHPLADPGTATVDESRPALSPDGSRLAFVRWASPHSTSIVVRTLSSREERIVADSLPYIGSLDWHGDGRRLFFTSRLDGASSIWRVPADGSGPPERFLPTAGALDIGEVTVARTGLVAFEQSVFDVDVLGFDLTGETFPEPGPPRTLVRSDRAEFAYTPSPDGRRAVFLTDRSGALELWSAVDGEAERRLEVPGVAVTSRPRWSPDGSRVALSVRRDDQNDLAVVHLSDGHVELVTRTPEREMAPSWRPDGLALRFTVQGERGWDLWELELWNPAQRRLLVPGGEVSQAVGADRLLYFRHGEGLYLQVGDQEPRHLQVDFSPQDWDNWQATERGIFSVRRDGRTVHFYDFETDKSVDILQLEHPASRAALAVSPDGSGLFVSQVVRDTSSLMIVPIVSPADDQEGPRP